MKLRTSVQEAKQIAIRLLSAWLIAGLSIAGPALAADDEGDRPTSAYVSIGKPMVLNLSAAKRLTFLQIGADVLIADDDAEETIKLHMPAIRHSLILLLSEQPAGDMKSPAKREELRQQATARVKGLIAELSGSDPITEILFSEVLVQ